MHVGPYFIAYFLAGMCVSVCVYLEGGYVEQMCVDTANWGLRWHAACRTNRNMELRIVFPFRRKAFLKKKTHTTGIQTVVNVQNDRFTILFGSIKSAKRLLMRAVWNMYVCSIANIHHF